MRPTAKIGAEGEADHTMPRAEMPMNAARLRHELEIHQIELRVQDAELRRTQLELEASRERYFDLYHYAPVGYCTIDEQGRILEANLRAATLLGTSIEALEWRPLVRFVLVEDQATFVNKQRLAFAGLTRESFEVNLRQATGDTLAVWVVLAARKDDARGQERVGLVALSDMTLAKKAERERQELQSQLFQAQKIESIGALTSTLAHDFNNLLTGIMSNLALLEADLDGKTDTQIECLQDVKILTMQGSQLTRQLLDFARRNRVEQSRLDIGAVFERTCRMCERTNRNIEFVVAPSTDATFVFGNSGQLEQVALNLIMNASQAMPRGGALRLAWKQVMLGPMEVEPHGVNPGRYVKISIIDNGIGMTESVRQRVFEPFFTTRESAGGSGLGLTSVLGIVKNHHGFITVESALGGGSAFFVYLPSVDQPQSTRTLVSTVGRT